MPAASMHLSRSEAAAVARDLLMLAVELRLGEIRAGQLQDLVGLAQLANLALEFLDALLLGCRRTRPCTAVALALANPPSQRLGRAADLRSDRLDRRPLCRV